MPGRLGPRFAIEALFLIALAAGAAYADLDARWIAAIMAGGRVGGAPLPRAVPGGLGGAAPPPRAAHTPPRRWTRGRSGAGSVAAVVSHLSPHPFPRCRSTFGCCRQHRSGRVVPTSSPSCSTRPRSRRAGEVLARGGALRRRVGVHRRRRRGN